MNQNQLITVIIGVIGAASLVTMFAVSAVIKTFFIAISTWPP